MPSDTDFQHIKSMRVENQADMAAQDWFEHRHNFDFEAWAVAVRRQLLAALNNKED